MARWLTYQKERFPLPVYLLLSGGMTLSGVVVCRPEASAPPVAWTAFAISFAGVLLFFGELRLMDELKDHEKDKIAHPERPLPRGLLSVEEVRRVVYGVLAVMALFGVCCALVENLVAGAVYLFITGYLFLMFKEFFVGGALSDRPFLYAVTHQIILFPLCAFAGTCVAASNLTAPAVLWYATGVFGSFFTYEVCRKLDPKAHPVLKTYLAVYGPYRTAMFATMLTAIACVGAFGLSLQWYLWPVGAVVIASLPLLWLKPEKFKIVESLATLGLLGHIWVAAAAILLRGRP
jgi:4-hydroxybenzoate polyprenyltransferase